MKSSCAEAITRLYEFLDNELPPEEAARIKLHFERCGGCNDFLNFCDSFKQAMSRVAADQPCAPPELRDRISAILRKHCSSPVSYPAETRHNETGTRQT